MNLVQLFLSFLTGTCIALLASLQSPYDVFSVSCGVTLLTILLLKRISKLRKKFEVRLEIAERNLGLATDQHKNVFQKYSALLGFKQVFSSQFQVDEHLEGLAQALKEACDREIKRQGHENFDDYLERIENLKERVRETKDAFWRAHGFAKAVGYRVYEKFTDYLSESSPAAS